MTDVVSVKFKGRGKTYFFDPGGVEVSEGDQVVVETSKGLELADCVQGNHTVTDERIVPPLRPVIRIATADDRRISDLCKKREDEAFSICEKKIAEHGLDMKLVDVECNFEGNKILFFFTSDGRVDFRDLVKDLAGVFRTRIELRQIGVRDEAKMLGGLGICGRPFCCHQFLDDFEPVSTKMAKTQSLSLNPTKISGSCGRLMCCLRYEQEAYEELVKTVPKNGAFVETTSGYGNVAQVNLLRQKVKVRLDGGDESLKTFDAEDVAAVPGGRPKPGEPLPKVLKAREKKPEAEETEELDWKIPPMFAEDTAHPGQPTPPRTDTHESREPAEDKKPGSGSRRRRPPRKKPSAEGGAPAKSSAPKPAQQESHGENKKPNGNRSRHKPSQGAQQAAKAPENAARQDRKPAPDPAGQSAAPQDGAAKKPNNNRRRYRGKPKPKQDGGPKPE